MPRACLRIACGLLFLGTVVLLLCIPRELALTRAVYEYHRKLTVGSSASSSGWYEESDSPVPPGPAGISSSDGTSSAPPASHSQQQQQQQENKFPHLANLCRDAPWNPNLTLHCHSGCGADQLSLCGGLAEARNRVQTCLRLAIDAGAGGGLIIPPIVAVGAESKQYVCPGSLWDMAGLQQTLGNWCPGLKVRTTAACRDGEDGSASDKAEHGEEERQVKTVNLPSRSQKDPHYSIATSSSSSKSSFRKVVEGFLHEASLGTEPVVVRYRDPYLAWDYAGTGEMVTVRRDLFQALQYNASLLALGRAVVDQMAEVTEADGRFIGVHLVGEDEWAKTGTGGIEALIRGYVEAIRGIGSPSTTTSTASASAGRGDMRRRRRGISGNDATPDDQIRTVYLSCKDPAAVQKLRETLQPLNYTVYDTRTLLKPGDDRNHQQQHGNEILLAQIEALGPEQRDAIEYEVLVHARYWLGVSTSPLSTLIAHARGGMVAEEEATPGWFEKYVYPHSARIAAADGSAARREYARDMVVRGDRVTKLLAVSGDDITDYFP
ncbi:hypothetical protein PG985_005905 [Apiospora marii]|uniref:Alternative oxidase n=1 Tax=Apiospora marii TaxID=335849 RepID=A0ABR1SD85_9PEZI